MATQNSIDTNKPIGVDDGGTGAATLTDHGVLVGSGTGALTALAVGTNGQVAVGSTGADPVFATIGSTDGSITVTGGAGTLVLEGTAASVTQVGSVELTTDAEAIAGADTTRAVTAEALKAKLGAQTDHGVLVGSGTAAAVTALAVGTDGQVILGSTGADPVFATLTSSGGTVTFTPGAGTLNLEAAGGGGAKTINNQTGTTYTLALSDADKFITFTNSDLVTVTVPTNASVAFDIGTEIGFQQGGDGKVFFSGAVPPTLQALGNIYVTDDQYAVGYMIKIDTDVWSLSGDFISTGWILNDTALPFANNVYALFYGNGVWVAGTFNGYIFTATDPAGTWTSRSNPFFSSNNDIEDIFYGNSVWVAVGESNRLATATDPTSTWTGRISSFSVTINGVAYDGSSLWVAVGDTAELATATDPTSTWTQRTSSFTADNINGVAYGNGVWVAVGAAGKLATATDPTGTWTQRTSSFSTTEIFGVHYGNGVWVAVGASGKLATATDPTGTWTQRTTTGITTTIKNVFYGNGIWVAAGFSGRIITTTDPTGTWTNTGASVFGADDVYDVHYAAGASIFWVAVGENNSNATSYYPI